jgi:hypothetical protein
VAGRNGPSDSPARPAAGAARSDEDSGSAAAAASRPTPPVSPRQPPRRRPDDDVAERDDTPNDDAAERDDETGEVPEGKKPRTVRRLSATARDWRKIRWGVRLLLAVLGTVIGLGVGIGVFLVFLVLKPEPILHLPWKWFVIGLFVWLIGVQCLNIASSCFFLFAPIRHGAKRLARIFCGSTAVIGSATLLTATILAILLAGAFTSPPKELTKRKAQPFQTRPVALTPKRVPVTPRTREELDAQMKALDAQMKELARIHEEMEKTKPEVTKSNSPGAFSSFVGGTLAFIVLIILLVLILAILIQPYVQLFFFRALARNLKADELGESCVEYMKLALGTNCVVGLSNVAMHLLVGKIDGLFLVANAMNFLTILVTLCLFVWYCRILLRLHGEISDYLARRGMA